MNTSKPNSPTETMNTAIEVNEKDNGDKNHPEKHSFVLSKREAKAASPADMAVCGEEDPGEALEFLVTEDTPPKNNP